MDGIEYNISFITHYRDDIIQYWFESNLNNNGEIVIKTSPWAPVDFLIRYWTALMIPVAPFTNMV